MSYTETITQAAIDTLTRTSGLPTFQLSGHVPNLGFWMREVRHAKEVLGGYKDRFDSIATAQAAYDVNHPGPEASRREHHEYDYAPLKVALTPGHTTRLMRQLGAVAERLIERCLQEELIDLSKADDLREIAGLPPFDQNKKSHNG